MDNRIEDVMIIDSLVFVSEVLILVKFFDDVEYGITGELTT